ncbi:MAG: ATP-binding protein [Providencia sp.]|uniref:ATP-binding protein n=1 Tax=Providencia sp. TaxID=589 RepID=UPI001B533EEC|nr:ATP-binding protein [Providencia sp.]MBP6081505.1 ATP-binding protein [Providencia sp.]
MKTDNKNNIPPQAMSIAAFSMCEPDEPIMPFVPSWYNVWESHMLNLANKRTGSCHWAFRRYGVNHKIYPNEGIRNASYRPYLHSMERSCDYAVSKLNIRNKLSLRKGNNGFIYVESWGEISTFEDISSWRDSFNINIVPKSILKKYGIRGFSCKVRGERNGLMSALLLAQDLLSCNEFDNIFICGAFRAIPVLVFSEIENQPKNLLKRLNDTNNQISVERTGCLILNKEKNNHMQICVRDYFILPKGNRKASDYLSDIWKQCLNSGAKSLFTTALPTVEFRKIQRFAFKKLGKRIEFHQLNDIYGDSGCMMPALMWEYLSHVQPTNSYHAMTVIDGDRGGWLLELWEANSQK